MRYLLNSAVITTPGKYIYRVLSVEEARKWLDSGPYKSTIGYAETAQAITLLLGVSVEVNKEVIKMNVGDEGLVFRLTRRFSPSQKGNVSIPFVLENHEIGVLIKMGE